MVPKDLAGNLAWREKLVLEGDWDKRAAQDIWIACKRDLLFYINSFCWLFEPRAKKGAPKLRPFITYDYQDETLGTIADNLGVQNIHCNKSRGMGATYMFIVAMEHRWHFFDYETFLCISRVEDDVDKTDDPRSIFWKIDLQHQYQPTWLLGFDTQTAPNRMKLHLFNPLTNSTIDGISTQGNVARGDRRTAIFMDEFAAVDPTDSYRMCTSAQYASDCCIFNSTPQGIGNAFYDQSKPDAAGAKIELAWWRHPEFGKGVYLDEQGKRRSPWYDLQRRRANHPREISQELDMSFLGSGDMFFNAAALDDHEKAHSHAPYKVGELDYDSQSLQPMGFKESPFGRLHLWILPDARGKLPGDREFVAACDIATGTGASDSVITVGDKKSGEKVAEFVANRLRPDELACMAVALCRWFEGDTAGALLNWESNGPGRAFGNRIVESGYRRIWYRREEGHIANDVTDIPGWFTSKSNKNSLLGEYNRALASSSFINRSKPAIRECRAYVFQPNGSVEHSKAMADADPSATGDNHGDRVIADALCWWTMKGREAKIEKEFVIPVGSLAWRMQLHEREEHKGDWW